MSIVRTLVLHMLTSMTAHLALIFLPFSSPDSLSLYFFFLFPLVSFVSALSYFVLHPPTPFFLVFFHLRLAYVPALLYISLSVICPSIYKCIWSCKSTIVRDEAREFSPPVVCGEAHAERTWAWECWGAGLRKYRITVHKTWHSWLVDLCLLFPYLVRCTCSLKLRLHMSTRLEAFCFRKNTNMCTVYDLSHTYDSVRIVAKLVSLPNLCMRGILF